eukprot:CAMPEP_0198266072 /NCGR_PEP_ID=MMETSP1447-20131203/26288_1 /TAXON_ID=420782 /ORGANISM="Chaetoceros dichaeta, Strain CCMP1751" /LENGTH=161 /DNA_ID=CAMNT_0043955923 /DNA_START=214 /DNA_END=695 /DNA_ORIENTATION=+
MAMANIRSVFRLSSIRSSLRRRSSRRFSRNVSSFNLLSSLRSSRSAIICSFMMDKKSSPAAAREDLGRNGDMDESELGILATEATACSRRGGVGGGGSPNTPTPLKELDSRSYSSSPPPNPALSPILNLTLLAAATSNGMFGSPVGHFFLWRVLYFLLRAS